MKYSILAIIAVFFMSCSDNDEIKTKNDPVEVDYTAENDAEIKAYIEENKLNAQRSDSGLYYVINEEGTGKQPTATSNVTVAYKFYLTDKNVIEETQEEGVSLDLQQTIKGWIEGIPYFKEGGSGILLIPAHLGYGNSSTSDFQAGSVLIFEVKLISVI